jgi:hypothetical protein
MTRWSKVYTLRSNARRAARVAGCNPSSVRCDRGGYVYDETSKLTKKAKQLAKSRSRGLKERLGKDKPRAARATKATSGVTGTTTEAALKLMLRNGGATITEICQATRWLPHTARARISGIAKARKDLDIVRTRNADKISVYTATATRQLAMFAGEHKAA